MAFMKGDIGFLTESAGERVTFSLKTLVREGPQLVWRRQICCKPGAPIIHPPIQSIGTDGAGRKQQPGTQRKLSPLSPSFTRMNSMHSYIPTSSTSNSTSLGDMLNWQSLDHGCTSWL